LQEDKDKFTLGGELMKRRIRKGKTLLVDGPASVELISGKAEVLGATFKKSDRIVIRDGKRVPFEVKKDTTFNLMVAESASLEEIDGSTVPVSWETASEEIVSMRKPSTVMVMGEVDSGKTSFCVYLANKALKRKLKVAVIDGDLGQSDVGPPSTIGFCHMRVPVRDLFELEAENACFVGVTSPSSVTSKVITRLTSLKNASLGTDVDFLILNTDGWVDGEDAIKYKIELAERVAPDVVVGIQHENELAPILSALKDPKTVAVDSPLVIRKRDREKRKILRQLSYKKYLKGAKVQSFSLNWIRVEGALLTSGNHPITDRIENIRELLGTKPLYYEETPTTALIVLWKNQWFDEAQTKMVEEVLGRKVIVTREGEEDGLLVGLENEEGKFLGIGIIRGFDYKRRVMKVYTPVSEAVSAISVGQVKLDEKGRELRISQVFDH
jgi:polynucleotide 5'-hydroxyl-kinase GRC3/NOL9